MSGDEFIYRGNLAATPLPEILATIHRHKVPGVMELSRDEITKRIFVSDGDIIFVTSSDREESLGAFLLHEGRISPAQYRVSCDELARCPGKRHGTILVELGFLTTEELGPLVRDQVQRLLWEMFDWGEGEVTFRVGSFRGDEIFQITLPTPRAILSGCRRISDGRTATGRLGGRQTVFRRRVVPQHLANLRLESGEQQLLDLMDGRRTFVELCEQGPFTPGLNARVVYGLAILQLAEPERAPAGSPVKVQVRTNGEG